MRISESQREYLFRFIKANAKIYQSPRNKVKGTRVLGIGIDEGGELLTEKFTFLDGSSGDLDRAVTVLRDKFIDILVSK